jgi:hypothetical protein
MGLCASNLEKRTAQFDSITGMLAVDPLAQQTWLIHRADTKALRFQDCADFDLAFGRSIARLSSMLGPDTARRACHQAGLHVETCCRLYEASDHSGSNLVKIRALQWNLAKAAQSMPAGLPPKRLRAFDLDTRAASMWLHIKHTCSGSELAESIWAVVDPNARCIDGAIFYPHVGNLLVKASSDDVKRAINIMDTVAIQLCRSSQPNVVGKLEVVRNTLKFVVSVITMLEH